ncbi:MAG: hypothetical protein Kow0099_01260 [Candidatus Abyssubacteria bacterium]
MQCPSCNTTLKRIRYEGLPICTCPGCNGEFVSLSQLRLIAKRKGVKFDRKEVHQLRSARTGPLKETQLSCPRCANPMSKKRYPSTEVVIDFCITCGGIWLDDRELEKIQILGELTTAKTAAAVLAAVRDAGRTEEGKSTEGEGYGTSFASRHMSVPYFWVRALTFGGFILLALGVHFGLLEYLLPIDGLIRQETLDIVAAGVSLFGFVLAFSYNKIAIDAGKSIRVTRYFCGIPFSRIYTRDELDYIGTDFAGRGFLRTTVLDTFIEVLLYGRYAYLKLYDDRIRGVVKLYIVLKNGTRVCLYRGNSDDVVGELSDFLRYGLNLRLKRL